MPIAKAVRYKPAGAGTLGNRYGHVRAYRPASPRAATVDSAASRGSDALMPTANNAAEDG